MASTPAAKGSIPQQINGPRRSMLCGVLIGIGVAGFIDEAVFHQLLHWHHFYDLSTPSWGLISDGLFHAGSWFCMVSGLFLFADLRRRDAWIALRHWAGFCLGLGGFQLYDGLVQHKWWHIHEIRYHVGLLPYDLAWNIVAAAILVVGILLVRRAQRAPEPPTPRHAAAASAR
jgi:uncharacterized membrane protein